MKKNQLQNQISKIWSNKNDAYFFQLLRNRLRNTLDIEGDGGIHIYLTPTPFNEFQLSIVYRRNMRSDIIRYDLNFPNYGEDTDLFIYDNLNSWLIKQEAQRLLIEL